MPSSSTGTTYEESTIFDFYMLINARLSAISRLAGDVTIDSIEWDIDAFIQNLLDTLEHPFDRLTEKKAVEWETEKDAARRLLSDQARVFDASAHMSKLGDFLGSLGRDLDAHRAYDLALQLERISTHCASVSITVEQGLSDIDEEMEDV